MVRTKYCCGGLNAKMIETHIPVTRIRNGEPVKFFTAIYECADCGELTLRGESTQLKAWNTFVEYLNEQTVEQLKKERIEYDMAKESLGELQRA